MITFLPHADFELSATCLDSKRLGKQRSEVVQLLRAVANRSDPLHHHSACVMWWGAQNSLVEYGVAVCDEWTSRGHDDSQREKILALRIAGPTKSPRWLGSEALHSSHRGNLLRKDPKWYGAFGWKDSPILPYVWPTNADPRLFRFALEG